MTEYFFKISHFFKEKSVWTVGQDRTTGHWTGQHYIHSK